MHVHIIYVCIYINNRTRIRLLVQDVQDTIKNGNSIPNWLLFLEVDSDVIYIPPTNIFEYMRSNLFSLSNLILDSLFYK